MSDVLTGEAERFLRVAELTGMELPGAITEKAGRLESLKVEKATLGTTDRVPAKSELLASGTPVDKVTEEHARRVAEARELKELHEAVWQAQGLAAREVSRLVAQERGNLILAMRPCITELVEKARPLAESLAAFAPKYDAGAIVRRASTKQVKDWREAEELERVFGACLAAWRSAWNASTTPGGHASPERVPDFDVRWVSQVHYHWRVPARVLEPRLNGTWYAPHRAAPSTIRPTLLGVACERSECGFRLATVAEMAELYRSGVRIGQGPDGGSLFDTLGELS